jgi:hypothetical protein
VGIVVHFRHIQRPKKEDKLKLSKKRIKVSKKVLVEIRSMVSEEQREFCF